MRGLKLMIVEDDEVSSLILRRTLEALGVHVILEQSGESAWARFQREPVSIVIADWMMPGMDGIELCRRLREHQPDRYTYFILLTSKGSREDRIRGLQTGADDYMVKPVDAGELVARLGVAQRILAMQQELTDRSEQMKRLHGELAQQNENLADAMTYLTHANRRFTELFEGLPAACYSWDQDGRIHEWNRAAVDMFGFQPQSVLTQHIWDVFREDDPEQQKENIRCRVELVSRIFSGESIVNLELFERDRHGKVLHILCNILPIRMTDGSITGAITASIDISEQRRLQKQVEEQLREATERNAELDLQRKQLADANAQLADLVVTDGLTGLKNHRYFRETVDHTFSFASRHGITFSVIMVDVDKFKQFNDAYGHLAGDDVLRTVADRLRERVRSHDIVARYGGEEFVVLCPATGEKGGRELAERLRNAIESHPWKQRQVTASFGVATFQPGVQSGSDLVDQADQALYRSKAAGRNRVTHFNDTPSLSLQGPRDAAA